MAWKFALFFAVCVVVAASQNLLEDNKKCAKDGEYCQNHWECCSNSCLSYSYKCVKTNNPQNMPPTSVSAVAAAPASGINPGGSIGNSITLDQLLDIIFGPKRARRSS